MLKMPGYNDMGRGKVVHEPLLLFFLLSLPSHTGVFAMKNVKYFVCKFSIINLSDNKSLCLEVI